MMAAPVGNKYYLKRSISGPRKYTKEELWEAFLEYTDYTDQNPWYEYEAIKSGESAGQCVPVPKTRPYHLTSFASYLGMSFQGLKNYGEKQGYEDTFEIYARIEGCCSAQKFEGAAIGSFNANIIARDLGLKENVEHSGITPPPTTFEVVVRKTDAIS